MKKSVLSSLLSVFLAAALPAAETLLERFDDNAATRGKLLKGATLEAAAGLERGALKAVGSNESLQYFYSFDLAASPGEEYAFSLNYRTSAKLPGGTLLALVVFEGVRGEKPPPSIYFRLPNSPARWMHRQFRFTVPAGAVKSRLMLRLANAPEGEWALIDHLRLAPVVDGRAKGIDLTEFETTFDQWQFNRHLVFDHFMPGPGGTVVNEWREAKIGEAFFRAAGDGTPMQYAMYIDNLRIEPGNNYIFEAWLKATDNFRFNGNGILIFFYKDAEGKPAGQSRYHIRPTGGEWKEFVHTFTAPENAVMLDIGLNLRNQPANEFIQLDHLRFKRGEDKAYLRFDIDPDRRLLTALAMVTGSAAGAAAKAQFTVVSADGKFKHEFSGEAGQGLEIDLAPFADGPYRLGCRLELADGKTLESAPQDFAVCNRPDWANDLGIQRAADPAPAPWRDLKLERNQVVTWNHRFSFDEKLQLRAITGIDDKEYFAAPLALTVAGTDLFRAAGPVRWSAAPSLISGRTETAGPDFRATLLCTVDYQGFTRYTVELTAQRDTVLDQAGLELKVSEVEFIQRNDGSWTNVGVVDLKKQGSWSSKHLYHLQYGNVERGICFYAPKLHPAQMDYDREWVRADRDGNLSISLVNAPLTLKTGEKHTIDFAVAPYPFRPNEENWRRLRFRAGTYNNFNLLWQTSGLMKYAGSLPETGLPGKLDEFLAKAPEYQLIYQIPTYIIETIPQWSYFASKWKAIPSRAYDMTKSHHGMMFKGDYRERSWTDLYIKSLAENMRRFAWNGVYYDCFGVDTFTENGETYLPLFECRNFQERVYNAQRLHKKDSLTVSHLGAEQTNPLASFSNVVLMGEQYRAIFMNHTYFLEFMTLDEFRYENAVDIGPDRMLLPQYRQDEKIKSPAATSHIMGMALLHNLMIYPNFIVKEIELAIRDRQYAFGMNDATFHGYYQSNPDGVATGNPAVVASYYRKSSGCFITVLNSSDREQSFTLKTAKTFARAEYFDPATGQSIAITPETALKLPPYLAAFITVAY